MFAHTWGVALLSSPGSGVGGTGKRKAKDELADHEIFAFLTTEANEIVRPIHEKAMPVILTEPDEIETWLSAPWEEAKALQRPFPADRLVVLS
jgi:putative SOS response-associated peptidase YedK